MQTALILSLLSQTNKTASIYSPIPLYGGLS